MIISMHTILKIAGVGVRAGVGVGVFFDVADLSNGRQWEQFGSSAKKPTMTGAARGLMGGQRRGLRGKATPRAPHGYVHPSGMRMRRNRPRQDRQPRQRDSTAEADREEPQSTGSPRPGRIDRTQQHGKAKHGKGRQQSGGRPQGRHEA